MTRLVKSFSQPQDHGLPVSDNFVATTWLVEASISFRFLAPEKPSKQRQQSHKQRAAPSWVTGHYSKVEHPRKPKSCLFV